MTWNSEDAKTWMIKYANTLASNGDAETSNKLRYDALCCDVCQSEQSFIQILKDIAKLDNIHIQWALKEVRHDG